MDQRLHRHERLTDAADFTRCYRHGKRLRTSYFTVYAYRRGDCGPRFGLAVGKTIGIAVVRNRVKRRLRELFRHHKALVPGGYDLFVRAGQASAAASYAALEVAWSEAMAMLTSGDAPAQAELTEAKVGVMPICLAVDAIERDECSRSE